MIQSRSLWTFPPLMEFYKSLKFKFMLNTGWLSPSSLGYGGDYPWTNEEKAYSSDNDYAETNGSVQSVWETFGIKIPTGATIKGIIVKLEGYYQTTLPDCYIYLYNNSGGAWTVYTEGPWSPDSTENEKEVGGEANLWGESWIVDDFSNANFGVKISKPATYQCIAK